MSQVHTVTIESLGDHGDGIARAVDGRRIFVPGTLPGEVVDVSLDGDVAKVTNISKTSAGRINPACAHFGVCGGCRLQHMSPALYSQFKVDQVREVLGRSNIEPGVIDGPHISLPGSRRRATLAAYRNGQKLVVGFNQSRSKTIVDLRECPVTSARIVNLLPDLRVALMDVLETRQGMDISITDSSGAIDMVMRPWVKYRPQGKKRDDRLPLHILECLSDYANRADIARLSWQNVASNDADLTPVAWRKPFGVSFSGTIVEPPPGAFLQATQAGEDVLVEAVVSAFPRKMKIADLYAGCGTFTFALGRAGHCVHAAEGFAPAIAALKKASAGLPVTVQKRDLAKDPLDQKELAAFDAVVLDPPRTGAREQIGMIAKSDMRTVIYVSCGPASFAHDAAVLQQAGFTLKSLRVVDQFLWSPHTELAGHFTRA